MAKLSEEKVEQELRRPVDESGMELDDYSWLKELTKYVMDPSSLNNGMVFGPLGTYHEDLKEFWDIATNLSGTPEDREIHRRAFDKLWSFFHKKRRVGKACDCCGDEDEYENSPIPPDSSPPPQCVNL